MRGSYVWRGAEYQKAVEVAFRRRVQAATIYLAGQIKADISQPGTHRYNPRNKNGKASKRQKTVYNFTHSAPGNPPYKQTGHLRRSIARELVGLKQLTGRVGSNLDYALPLEKGHRRVKGRRVAPRPFLVPNLDKHRLTLIRILTERMRPGELPRFDSNQSRSGVTGRGFNPRLFT